jgi:antirestriction protein ArdC
VAKWEIYQQWQKLGAQVRKSEKATTVVFWKFANGTAENQDGEEEQSHTSSRLLFTRGYSVFNAAQVEGYTLKPDVHTPIEERIERAEMFFKGVSARVVHQGNRAFYSPVEDTITLPPFGAFFTPVDYYSTRAHESAHNAASGIMPRCCLAAKQAVKFAKRSPA